MLNNQKAKYRKKQLDNYFNQLAHDYELSKHGFIKEALNNIFKGTVINSKNAELNFTNKLAFYADDAIAERPFYIDDSGNKKYCDSVNETITCVKIEADKGRKIPKSIQKFIYKVYQLYRQQHFDFITYTLDSHNHIIQIGKVSQKDMVHIFDAVYNCLKKVLLNK